MKLTYAQAWALMRDGDPFYVWQLRIWEAETRLAPFVPQLPLLIGV
jgi:hypothetical protein